MGGRSDAIDRSRVAPSYDNESALAVAVAESAGRLAIGGHRLGRRDAAAGAAVGATVALVGTAGASCGGRDGVGMADHTVDVDPASSTAPVGAVRLVDIRQLPLSVDEVVAAVADPTAGGTTLFIGTVRSSDDGRDVTSLRTSRIPTRSSALHEVAEEVARKHDAVAVAAVDRTGLLAIGDLAVVVAVAAGHRGEALRRGQGIDRRGEGASADLKQQSFADGSVAWVGIEATLDVEG